MTAQRTFEEGRQVFDEVHKCTSVEEKLSFYDVWARTYDQDTDVLHYNAPILAAQIVSSYFCGDRTTAKVLDVACGTGKAAKQLKESGFSDFVGLDGSPVMLEKGKETGLYKELKLCIIREKEPLPVPKDSFDIVVLVGGLCVGHLHYTTVRQLCEVSKPGGYICVTSREGEDNMKYKAALEQELKRMEEEQLVVCVKNKHVQNWEKSSLPNEDRYIAGTVYLYKKL